MASCPTDAALRRLVAGVLDETGRDRVESHLATCPNCRARVRDVREEEDLLAEIRGALGGAPPGGGSQPDSIPSALGRYRVLRRIGEGGMGIVYEAEQSRPRRRVALKVVRPGLVSKRLLRRFEHEAELLGRLDHPGIARVYEAGTFETPHGRHPFLAMELIEGRPLDDHARRRRTDVRARLELFLQLCDAVAHAHRQGVLHRDLKPENVLVTPRGTVKVLDFGIGRALDPDLALTTLQTESGQLLGTLPYMSPEQVSGESASIDTRADVYALGVILYELLAGRRPIDLREAGLASGVRAVLEREPPPLGTIDSRLRGDLETIASRALEKDRDRRYGSAEALADDVRRHLRDEPIDARPPTAIYQLRKFARRHRALVVGAFAVLVALVLGLVATASQLVRALHAEEEWQIAANEATARRVRAEREAARANKVSDLMQELLLQADPSQVKGEPTLREMLHEAARRADVDLAGEPDLEAELRNTLGRAFLALGAFDEARQQLERSLSLLEGEFGADDPRTTAPLVTLAQLDLKLGDYDDAERWVDRVLALHGEDRSEHEMTIATSSNSLAIARYFQGDLDSAERQFRDALAGYRRATGESSPDVATTLANLAKVVHERGRPDEAIELLERALPMTRATMGDTNPHVASALLKMAAVELDEDRVEAARSRATEALEIYRERLGEDHPSTANALVAVGRVGLASGTSEESVELFARALKIRVDALGADHPKVTEALTGVVDACLASGDAAGAEERVRDFLREEGPALAADEPVRVAARTELGRVLIERERFGDAATLLSECVRATASAPAARARACAHLARALTALGHRDEARAALEQCLAEVGDRLGDDHPALRAVSELLAGL